jgi:AcrR family transcriptional regulator
MKKATRDRTAGTTMAKPVRLMRRAERRAQVLDAATRAFARAGFAATSLDDIAAEAGVTRVILYRHFESKADLYRAVLERGGERLAAQVGTGNFSDESIPALLHAAAADPDAFRLLFRYAVREAEFRDVTDAMAIAATEAARKQLAAILGKGPWLDWAANLIPVVAIEAVIAWLDAGQPEPHAAAERIGRAVAGVIDAATLR